MDLSQELAKCLLIPLKYWGLLLPFTGEHFIEAVQTTGADSRRLSLLPFTREHFIEATLLTR